MVCYFDFRVMEWTFLTTRCVRQRGIKWKKKIESILTSKKQIASNSAYSFYIEGKFKPNEIHRGRAWLTSISRE